MRKLYAASSEDAVALRAAQYIKVVSDAHRVLTTALGNAFSFAANADLAATEISLDTPTGAGTIMAGDTFIVPEADPATVYTVTEDVEVEVNVPFTLKFTPGLTDAQVEDWMITLTPVTRRGEAVERTVVMTYESNKE